MSIPDHEIDELEICQEHGYPFPCYRCQLEYLDEYADEAIQDRFDRRIDR